jgi:phenylpropionate dioxygenase-like ring-hydroxylating dioxygenase large terminal subunit
VPKYTIPDELRHGLRNYWYPILLSSQLTAEKPLGIKRLGESLAVWRDSDGAPHVFVDRCAHRAAKLSIGDIVEGRLQCRYHGLQYDGTGQCRLVPVDQEYDGPHARRLSVCSYPVEERGGLVWAYLGDVEMFPPPPLHTDPELTDPTFASINGDSVWEANWLIVHDNTSDPTHVPFLHGHLMSRVTDSGLVLDRIDAGNDLVTPEMALGTVVEPLVAESTETTNFVKRAGATDDHSETFDEVAFELPCAVKVWVPIPIGGNPVRVIQYEMAIDEHRTAVNAWIGRQCAPEELEETRGLLQELFWPMNKQVFDEDSWITSLQPDVEEAWAHEHLLPFDVGPPRVRRLILDAYERQQKQIAEARSGAAAPT